MKLFRIFFLKEITSPDFFFFFFLDFCLSFDKYLSCKFSGDAYELDLVTYLFSFFLEGVEEPAKKRSKWVFSVRLPHFILFFRFGGL